MDQQNNDQIDQNNKKHLSNDDSQFQDNNQTSIVEDQDTSSIEDISDKDIKKPKKGLTARKKMTFVIVYWCLFLLGIGMVALLFAGASWGWLGKMPSFRQLENPRTDLATQVISSDGEQLGTFFRENRTPISYQDLPPHLVNALVATEDARYYEHSGIDFRATARAFASLGKRGGASTISQQLAKMLFSKGGRGLKNRLQDKLKEWVIATKLESQYTKDEIITMYLNKYDFLNQSIGIGSAARIYFGKRVQDLNVQESAMLVGMLKNSSYFNPLRREKRVTSRRNTVLSQMVKYKYLDKGVADSLMELPLGINHTPEGHSDGTATYFRTRVRKWLKQWAKKNPKGTDADGNPVYYDIYRDGLRVNVTIDSRMQKYAEQSVKEHLSNLQTYLDKQEAKNENRPFQDLTKEETDRIINKAIRVSERRRKMKAKGKTDKEILASFDRPASMRVFSWQGEKDTIMTPKDSIRYYKQFLRSGMISMDPTTGHVKAWVGGMNYKHFQFDHVYQGARQVGSTFKPFVYATAVDQLKLSPCDTLPRSQITIPVGSHGVTKKDWTAANSSKRYDGYLSLKQSLAGSVNTISARLMDRIGPKPVIQLARKMGITSSIPPVASICLGVPSLKLSEMVAAYSTFANQGIYTEPVFITDIEDKNGNVLYQVTPKTHDVISHEVAYVTLQLMEGVTQSGSGMRLRTKANRYKYEKAITGYPYLLENDIAGKTGTTQNHSDGWFMGTVPNLCTGVWVGGDDRAVHFDNIRYGQGATMALPIWALYMKKCYADQNLSISKEPFERPEKLNIEVNCKHFRERARKKRELEQVHSYDLGDDDEF